MHFYFVAFALDFTEILDTSTRRAALYTRMQFAMPTFFKHRPVGPLAQYIESFWYRPATLDASTAGMLILPTGHAEFVFNLNGAPQTNWTALDRGARRHELQYATVRLPQCAPVANAFDCKGATFGVAFKPYGLRHFSSMTLDSCPETALLSDFWGSGSEAMIHRLAEAPTPAAKFALMETLLMQRLREPHRACRQVEHAVALLSVPFVERSVVSVAHEVGLSPRRLLHLFHQDVGLSPKMFARIMRFGATLRLVRRGGAMRWTDVAATCNYFDQAHLVKEFHAFAGMTPNAYLGRETTGHATCLPWDPPASFLESRLDACSRYPADSILETTG
jgi:AraC-like DNA-binding protein